MSMSADLRTRQQLDLLSRAVEALLRQAEQQAEWGDQVAFRTMRTQLEQLRTGAASDDGGPRYRRDDE
jgi:hypothetical protein